MKACIHLFILVFILFFPNVLSAKEIKYKVADIPKELRENAQSVVRNDIMELEISSVTNATLKVSYAITVLNKNGIDDAYFSVHYDKFSKVSNIKGKVYDENGEQIRRIPADEIFDISAVSGYAGFDDYRRKYFDPKVRTIPFTVEYSYEVSYSDFLDYPSWSPYSGFGISTEFSSFKVITPQNFILRYFENNVPVKAIKKEEAGKAVFYWEMKNLKAIVSEPYNYFNRDYFSLVKIAPSDFEMDDTKGNLDTWVNFGNWFSNLNLNRDNLNEESKSAIKKLVEGYNNKYDKVQKIYEYMQGKTRYVSIQLGIGGYQPFEAATVDRLSYGDCKGLTNYMKTMLDVVGIKSYYCLVYAGEYAPYLIKEFPSSQFNHAFLCVPIENDTVWLECTSQRLPFGYIGDFTDDRDILLIEKDKSRIVHTKTYTSNDNLEIRKTSVTLQADGGGSAIVNTLYKGLNYEQILPIYVADDTDKKRLINNRINLPNFQLRSADYKENRDIIPSFNETLNISFSAYGTQMPPRMFFPVNFMNRFSSIPERVRNRKTDVYIRRPFVEIDTVIYGISEHLRIENLPRAVTIESKFGKYVASSEMKDSKIIYSRYFELWKGKYPPASYPELLEFLEKIAAADGAQCSLVKK